MLFDTPLTRLLAHRIERHDNRLLGTQRTMGLARGFNRVKNRRQVRTRDELFPRLDDLMRENGAPKTPRITLEDGYFIDRSGSLPHLDRMIEDAQTIIAERGGVVRAGGVRQHFQQILTDEHVARFPSILDFATSSDVLQSVIGYLGFLPTLSAAKPLGIRLAESRQDFIPDWDGVYRASQLFHSDYHDCPMVYVIVCLRDVTPRCGPFSFLPLAASERAAAALRYHSKGRAYRVSDDEMWAVADKRDLVEFCAPKGTVLFLDSSRCFHYGSRDALDPRYLMMVAYVSVARTDFTDLLRKESPRPLQDPETRERRMRYPVAPGAPLLRRLVLDREYAG